MTLLERIRFLSTTFSHDTVKVRRHLHANPELSYQEHETVSYVAAQLKAAGVDSMTILPTAGGLQMTGIF